MKKRYSVQIKKVRWKQSPEQLAMLAKNMTIEEIAKFTGHTTGSTENKLRDLGIKAKSNKPKPKEQFCRTPKITRQNPEFKHKDGQPVNYLKPPSKNEQYNRSWKHD